MDGTLEWGTDRFHVYYEHCLAYLCLSSGDKAGLDRLWDRISRIVFHP